MNLRSFNLTAAILLLAVLIFETTSAQEEEESPNPYALPFDIPEWLIPKEFGGKLPFLATDQLTVVGCSSDVEINSYCELPGLDNEGVFVCRRFGPLKFSICTPNVMTDDGKTVLGVEGDECGCCGAPCPEECKCECNDGRGVMIETHILRWWHVKVCVGRAWAQYITPLREGITCGVC